MKVQSSLTKASGRIAQGLLFAGALFAVAMGPGRAWAQRAAGIDVSSYQGSQIGWPSVKSAGYSFAWAKATEGVSVTDPDFAGNVSNGKNAGVLMGAYDLCHPNNNAPGSEASHFWNVAGGYITADGKSIMPVLDFEIFSGLVGASTYSAWANDWCNDIVSDAAGAGAYVKPVLYTYSSGGCEFDGSVAQWTPWIAAPDTGQNPETGNPWSYDGGNYAGCDVWGSYVWDIWQVGTGSVPGVPVAVDVDFFNGPSASSLIVSSTVHHYTNRKGMARTADGGGYWIVASDGGVFTYGDGQFYGSMGGQHLNAPVVAMAARPQGDGYWLTGSDGGIYAFGNAPFDNSLPGLGVHVNNIVGIASTADGNGYWLVGADGGIYAFGDAPFHGSLPGLNIHVNNIVGMAATSGNGYWLVGSDGGIYSFSANFYGSMGGKTLSAPVVGMSARPQSDGYWLTGSDGAIYAFGNAGYDGGMNGHQLSQPIVGIQSTADGGGYWLVGGDGAIYSFGDAGYHGGAN